MTQTRVSLQPPAIVSSNSDTTHRQPRPHPCGLSHREASASPAPRCRNPLPRLRLCGSGASASREPRRWRAAEVVDDLTQHRLALLDQAAPQVVAVEVRQVEREVGQPVGLAPAYGVVQRVDVGDAAIVAGSSVASPGHNDAFRLLGGAVAAVSGCPRPRCGSRCGGCSAIVLVHAISCPKPP